MKESRKARLVLLLASTLLVAAMPVSTGLEILRFESQRSLGDGRLATLLASPDAATAARAALAIGRSKQPAGVTLLEGHLADRRDAVRALSIYGLGLIGLGSDVATILRAAGSDHSGAVRLAAVDALERYESAGKLAPADERAAAYGLSGMLDGGERDPAVRGRAAIALNAFADGPQGAYAAQALQRDIAGERDAGVRQRVFWTVFRRYAAKVPPAMLRSALHDPDEIVRIEAVRAYGKLKNAALAADLQPLLADASWRVQEQAAESIRVLQGGKMSEHLTAIPASVHTPAPQPDPYASLAALPRVLPAPGPPRPADVPGAPRLLAQTAASMLQPARGPHPRLRIVTTQGNIYVALYPEWAPLTVANFLNMMNRGFLDDNPWFRIVPDFVVQTGEKDAKNAPGPGYSIPAEENPLEQNSYVISMGLNYDEKTNMPIRDSAGSEYYITLSPQYHLDEAFTVFGAVISGSDVLGRLSESDKVIRIERVPDVVL
jgi:peptidyl-prolyl cis-trans isomerase B (cyclophilin B)